jgi:hypothetical protein
MSSQRRFYYELVREQGDGEGNYVLTERQCIPKVDMPEPCYMPERGRRNFRFAVSEAHAGAKLRRQPWTAR